MYSFYFLHRADMVNNNGDMVSRSYVLNAPDDLARALAEIAAEDAAAEYGADVLELRVYQDGRLAQTRDLREGEERGGLIRADAADDIPALEGTPLPAGHPVRVEGRLLQYGCTSSG
ncbi:hypothetical protein [Spirillospora sp. NBC_01491]|uniref:hypothetical protein n=1 Tax=Spirillospora sp. NBC_01491 TaxID=2976007 RepID=UPI002E35235D|nr:hypothetical protein [Spirillospora sp. NBC_01491]